MGTINRAVVIGGSIAGLATAATLSSRAREVVVIERREPSDRSGATSSIAPQGHLPHVMLVAGQRVLESLVPGFAAGMLAGGASSGGNDPRSVPCHWVASGALRDHLPVPDFGHPRALGSRAQIESQLRAAVLALPNVVALAGSAEALDVATDRACVRAVRLRGHGAPLEADLVVDAGGRNSRVPEWLAAAGQPQPPVTEVVVDLRYTAFVVERRPDDFDGAALVIVQNTPAVSRIGVALPMEGHRWQIALGGYFGAAAPTDSEGAREFARSLTDPCLSTLLERPFLAEPARYTFRSSQRRHWERAAPHPLGLCALGDSVASFNPIYGQGMSSALLQAEALGAALDRYGPAALPRRFAHAAARVVDTPWRVATGADFVYPQTQGKRPPGTAFVNGYVERVNRAAAVDEHVNAALTGVQQLLAAPPSLFRPGVVARTVRHGGRNRSAATAATGNAAGTLSPAGHRP